MRAIPILTRNARTTSLTLALLAALALSACASAATGASTRRATPAVLPAATPRPVSWTTVNPSAAVQQAPAGVRVVYQGSGQDGVNALHRSDDAGATWRRLPWPRIAGVTLPADVEWDDTRWSEQAPQTVFVDMTVKNDAACPRSAIAPIPTGIPNTDPSTTGTYCELSEVSDDGGATWRAPTFPDGKAWSIVGFTAMDSNSTSGGPIVQDSRMYALFTPTQAQFLSGSLYTQAPPPVASRLLASDDGGGAWKQVDGPINAAGQQVLGLAAAPVGAAIFALTEPKGASPREVPAHYYLWSSSDGGATWSAGGVTPGKRADGMQAAYNPATGKATVYLLVDDDNVDLHIYASADGGHTWPNDLDLNTEEVGPSASPWLLGPLPDGGVAIFDNAGLGVKLPDPPPTTNIGAISEWRPDMSWPRPLTGASNLLPLAQTVIVPEPQGGAMIWLAGYAAGSAQSMIEYAATP